MADFPFESALNRLRDGEICLVVLKNGSTREAFWSIAVQRFFFTSEPLGAVSLDDIDEWWPAGTGF